MKSVKVPLMLCVLLLSCSDKHKQNNETELPVKTEVPLKLIDKGVYTLPLDSLADFERLLNIQVNAFSGKEYLSFFDSNSNTFHIHDYESGTAVKKIRLAQEGPDKISVFMSPDYYLHSLDSVFIDTNFYGYFLINGKGEILASASKGPDFSSEEVKLKFDQSSYLSDKGIHGTIKAHFRKKTEHFPLLRGTLRFSEGKPKPDNLRSEALFDNYEEIMSFLDQAQKQKKLYTNVHRHIMYNGEYLYATTVISDSIRVFRDQKLIKSIYAGVPSYEVIDYKTYFKNNELIQGKGQMSKPTVLYQPPVYESTLMDPQGKFIYRVMSHGTKPGISPYNGKEIPVIHGATLLVINLEDGERYYYELPVEEILIKNYGSSSIFVSNKGIHFRVKDQGNEEEVQFRVFGPDKG